jgi:peptidoglycan/LPS O-acetylase OafA/YrhL
MRQEQDFVTAQRRSDIEGLRAIAVVVVLVFHGFPTLLPFGYLGVDMFFVISGFVITQSLMRHSGEAGIQLWAFYARRVRRLFPALAVVIVTTLALCWFVLLTDEYRQTATLGLAASFSVANLRLLHEAGYFDVATTTKPLMHLWSLGVEEQFYLVWPLVLMALARSRRPVVWAACGAVVSLVLFAYWAIESPAHAFYNPMGRAWELLAGAVLAWLPARLSIHRAVWWCGTAMLFAGLTDSFSTSILANTVLVVSGSAAVIAAGRAHESAPLLSSRPLQWLGRVSYPLYLWHWPGLAIRNLLGGNEISAPGFTILWLMASLALADRTHAWIERPVAKRPIRQVTVYSSIALLVPLCFCGIILANAGFPLREVVEKNAMVSTAGLRAGKQNTVPECVVTHAPRTSDRWCARDKAKKPDSVVWGDSKGDALYWGLVRETRTSGLAWMLIGSSGCPTSDDDIGSPHCRSGRALPLKAIADSGADQVVLVAASRVLVSSESRANFEVSLREVTKLGISVVVFVDNPTVLAEHDMPTSCARNLSVPWLAEMADRRTCSVAYSTHVDSTADYLRWLKGITAAAKGAVLFDPAATLCDISKNECPAVRDGQYLYSYGDHISDVANSKIARAMVAAGAIRID